MLRIYHLESHTLKAQVIIDKKSKCILSVMTGKGREHDFKLFKRCNVHFHSTTEVLGDRGYQGLQHLHSNTQTPQRKPPRKPLSKEAKKANRNLASRRIAVEHVIRKRSTELTPKSQNLSYSERYLPQQTQAFWSWTSPHRCYL
jgi:IS5 family transposase